MKWLKIFGLGIAILGLSLIWLEVNQFLMSSMTLGIAIGFSLLVAAYFLGRYFGQYLGQHQSQQSQFH